MTLMHVPSNISEMEVGDGGGTDNRLSIADAHVSHSQKLRTGSKWGLTIPQFM